MSTFAIGNITGGEHHVAFTQSMLLALKYFHYKDYAGDVQFNGDVPDMTTAIFHISGPYLDDGRNIVVEKFLNDTTADTLVFVDSDIEFSPHDLLLLLSHDFSKYPVVAGSYRNLYKETISTYPNAGWSPVIFLHHPNGSGPGGKAIRPIGDDGWGLLTPTFDDPNLFHAHVVGAGFLALSRTFLIELGEHYGNPCPWFAEPVTQDKVHLGEDTGFCLRALELGYPIVVDPRIRLNHFKTITIPALKDA